MFLAIVYDQGMEKSCACLRAEQLVCQVLAPLRHALWVAGSSHSVPCWESTVVCNWKSEQHVVMLKISAFLFSNLSGSQISHFSSGALEPCHPGNFRAPRGPLFGTHRNALVFVAFAIRMRYNLGHDHPANPGKDQSKFLEGDPIG